MSRNSRTQLIRSIILLCSFLFILSFKLILANDDTEKPSVLEYKMISTNDYISNATTSKNIGIIVKFNTSFEDLTMDINTTYAKLNLSIDNPQDPHVRAIVVDSITLENGENYTPKKDEILFGFIYNNHDGYYYETTQTEPNLLKVQEIILNDEQITVDMEPEEGYRIYYDTKEPKIISADLLTEQAIGVSYQYNEILKVKVQFSEEIVIDPEDISDAFKLEISDYNGNSFLVDFTEYLNTTNGSKEILLGHRLGEELRIKYSDGVRVLIDESKIIDLAGNQLLSGGYFGIGYPIIDAIYPLVTQEVLPSYNDYITIKFDDDDTNYSFDHLTNNWEVGILLSEDKIEGNIEDKSMYVSYPLLFTEGSGNNKSYLNYYANENIYKLNISMLDEIFSKADNKDQNWYFYYYIKDEDGNIVYHEIENLHIDKKQPDITISGDYLEPKQNQYIEFEITDSEIERFNIFIKDLNDNEICSFWYYLPEFNLNNLPEDYYLQFDNVDSTRIKGTINVDEMVNQMPESLQEFLETDRYKLVIQASDKLNSTLTSEEIILFTIDKTAPTVIIKIVEGDEGTLKSYKLSFSDIDGNELSGSKVAAGAIALYYDFVETGLLSYNEVEINEQIVVEGEEVEVIIPYGELQPQTYCLNIKAVDQAGNKLTTISAITFEVKDISGNIDCDNFANDLNIDASYRVISPYDDIEYRVSVDDTNTDNWTNWKPLNHIGGSGTLLINLEDKITQGEHEVYVQYRYMINNSYVNSTIKNDSFIYDIEGPMATIQYSNEKETFEPVEAELIQWEDNYSNKDNIKVRIKEIPNSEGMKKVTLNTASDIKTFILTDEAGNESEYISQATWINGEVRPAAIIYSTLSKTRDNVSVYLDIESMNNGNAEVELIMENINPSIVEITTNNDGVKTFIFKENGIYDFKYMDDRGKIGYIAAYISNIDREKPTVDISYSNTKLTNGNVYGFIKHNEPVEYSIYDSNGQLLDKKSSSNQIIKHLFSTNGSVTVLLEDESGNSQSYNLSVDWIDKTLPNITVKYSDNYYETTTEEDITVTILADEPIYVINNFQDTSRVFRENEEFTFMVEDFAGNRVDMKVKITNIDNSKPIFNFKYSETDVTNKDVIVELTCDKSIEILNNGGSKFITFNENGKKYFKIKYREDIIYKSVEITNIDKQPPVMKFDMSDNLFIETSGSVNLDCGFNIIDEIDGNINEYTIIDNINSQVPGIYYADYTFSDEAGNETTVRRNVEVLSKGEIVIVVNGYRIIGNLFKVKSSNLYIDVYNTLGNYELQYKEGVLNTSKFKKNKKIIEHGYLELESGGYITIYVQDQERNWKLVRCYILK